MTVAEAAAEWLGAAEAGVVRTRSGDRYKPSALRSYREALSAKVVPRLGAERLSAVTMVDVQDVVDELVAAGLAASTVRNTVLPLRAIYRRALQRNVIGVNPTDGLALPAVRGRRDRVVDPDAAAALIAAVDDRDRALWATAFYAGLRRGELQALSWQNIDLQRGLITVTNSWDQRVGLIGPKSRSGQRNVPLTKTLRRELAAHRLKSSGSSTGYVFVGSTGRPFDPVGLLNRARKRWQGAGLAAVTLHECRHSYAAFMIAAGVNAKALSTYMGHSTITVTLDRYGHLLPGNEQHAAGLLDALLDAGTAGR